jgi:ankyrin repeat protein
MTQGGELLYNMIASGFSGLVPIEALLSRGVMLDLPDYERRTALHLAAQAGLEAEVNALLANGAAILIDQNGSTPLHEVVKSGRLEIVRSIPDHMQDDMENLLNHDHALQSLKTGAFVSLLCVFGSMQDAIGVKDSNGQTVLHYAVKTINVNLVKRLLDAGIYPGAVDMYSQNALHLLISRHFSNEYSESYPVILIIDQLLAAGVDILALDRYGRSALALVVSNRSRPLVEHLVAAYLR